MEGCSCSDFCFGFPASVLPYGSRVACILAAAGTQTPPKTQLFPWQAPGVPSVTMKSQVSLDRGMLHKSSFSSDYLSLGLNKLENVKSFKTQLNSTPALTGIQCSMNESGLLLEWQESCCPIKYRPNFLWHIILKPYQWRFVILPWNTTEGTIHKHVLI